MDAVFFRGMQILQKESSRDGHDRRCFHSSMRIVQLSLRQDHSAAGTLINCSPGLQTAFRIP